MIRTVTTFADFTADNDPHGEHDFGNPRQEFVDPVGRMLGDPGQDVGQPGLRIDIVQLGSDIEPLLAVWHAIRDQVTIGKCLPEPGTIRLLGG